MPEWNAGQYLKFEEQRTRPAIDLLAHVPLSNPKRCIDLGCGPGNSTELLVKRYPNAEIMGLDSSFAMLAEARQRLPGLIFEKDDIATWSPSESFDLIFANAALQWVPDHAMLLPRLVSALNPGGCLAIQVPDNQQEPTHVLMRDVAARGPWAGRLAGAATAREAIGSFGEYYTRLRQAGCSVDLWRTTYVHCLNGAGAIVEWVKGTGLRPFLDPLDEAEQKEFLALYEAEIAHAYPQQFDGKVLLRFPRLFLIARRDDTA
ncbi:trans-aconitate 2-methyltransferase [Microvirga sp. 2MCAF38]|uniref:trans-aconitate 2-methyltransferase n=1 Tax=Microvirga sp. 2MCAF38 TaxID=3232989 RepID=UPI003F96C331